MPPLEDGLDPEPGLLNSPLVDAEEDKDRSRAGHVGAPRAGRKSNQDAVDDADLLRLYMRDVGRVDHLTQEEECATIATIQSSRSAILATALQAPGAADLLLSWRDAYVRGDMPLRDIIEMVGSYEEHRSRMPEETGVDNETAGKLPIREAALRPGVLAAFGRIDAMRADGTARWSQHHAEAARLVEGLRLINLRRTELQDFLLSARRDLQAAEGRLLRHAQTLMGREEAAALIASAQSADDLARRFDAGIHGHADVAAALEAMRAVERTAGLDAAALRQVSASIRASLKAYESASNRLFRAHAGFVAGIARRFESSGAALVDLIQTGNLGLLRAVEKFEPGRSRFATYAEFWIRQFIAESIPNEVNTVHIASTVTDLSRRIAKAQESSLALHMRELTLAELSETLGEPVEKIRETMTTSGRTVSLDQPIGMQGDGEDGETPLKDIIVDEECRSPYEVALQSEMSRTFKTLLSRLPAQASRVIALRFGLDNGIELSPDEVAKMIGISRDKLARLEQSALRMLRSPIESPEVWSYSRQFG
jgi:RNA polymerase sigma factor (sigma-70 family)